MRPTLALLWRGLKYGSKKTIGSVIMFWKGGLWEWIGVTVFFLIPHLSAYPAGGVEAVFASAAKSLGTSWLVFVEAAGKAGAATGVAYWNLLVMAGQAALDIGWFFRSVSLGAEFIEGDDVSPLLVLVGGGIIFNIFVWAATGAFDGGVIPAVEAVQIAGNVPALFEFEKLVPERLGGPAVNETGSMNTTMVANVTERVL